jgi:DNA-binding transcriptional LysR family regulator
MPLLDAITAFVRVAELGSYTRAAEALELSRTRVSRLVMQLEALEVAEAGLGSGSLVLDRRVA